MTDITLSKDQKERVVEKVKLYFSEELDQEIGGFDAEFLIDFFAVEIGAFYYNRGLSDAQVLFTEKVEELSYLVEEMEKPTNYKK
ncbi:MAG: hypothetical protein ACJAZ0_000198 [Halioglobus sp.]|jgi:uncharacterized protein (DUF2164 family)